MFIVVIAVFTLTPFGKLRAGTSPLPEGEGIVDGRSQLLCAFTYPCQPIKGGGIYPTFVPRPCSFPRARE